MEKQKLREIREAEATQLMEDNLRQINDVKKMRELQQQQEEVNYIQMLLSNTLQRTRMKNAAYSPPQRER